MIDKTADNLAPDIVYKDLSRRHQIAYQVIGLHPSGPVPTTAVAAVLQTSAEQAEIVLNYLGDAGLIERVADRDEWTASDPVRTHAETCARSDPYRDSCNARSVEAITMRLIDYYRLAMNAANQRLAPHRPILRTRTDTPRSFPLPKMDSAGAARDWLGRHWDRIRHFWRLGTQEHPLIGMQYIDAIAVGRKILRRNEDTLTMLAQAQTAGQFAITYGDYDVALVCAVNIEDLAQLVSDRRALAVAAATRATVHRLRGDYQAASRQYSHEQEILTALRHAPGIADAETAQELAQALARSLIESAFVHNELGKWWTALADARRAVTLLMNLPNGGRLDLARARVELVAASVQAPGATARGELIRLVVRINRAVTVVQQRGVPHVTQRAYQVAAAVAECLPASLAGRMPNVLRAHVGIQADEPGTPAPLTDDERPSPQPPVDVPPAPTDAQHELEPSGD